MKAGRKALIIADGAMLLRYVSSVLAAWLPELGIITARRAGEGFFLADRQTPDLLLIDFGLPDSSGDAFCRRLAAHPATARIPVIALCGKGVDPRAMGPAPPNVLRVLTKPFTPESLVAAVREVLEIDCASPPAVPPAEEAELASPPRLAPAVAALLSTSRQRARLSLPQTPRAPVRATLPTPPRPVVADRHPPERSSYHGGEATSPRIAFRGTTATFSLPACLRTAVREALTGILRVFPTTSAEGAMAPTEILFRDGLLVLVTTRDLKHDAADRNSLPAGLTPEALVESARAQRDTGCPWFIDLLGRGLLGEREARALGEDSGQRLFARMWLQPRLEFEFEQTAELPGFVQMLSIGDTGPDPAPGKALVGSEDPDPQGAIRLNDWLLGTLRRLRPEELPGLEDEPFGGVPAYTRAGYETIRRLHLTELEAGFARQVNGRMSLRDIAGRLGLSSAAAFLLLFRFRSVELMDYWPATALTAQAVAIAGAGAELLPTT